ncbi:MAG: transcription elongation factor GreA [Evtepia sp.]|uniref:transcription elongation factor GreA n=1 Tax=Evtepia sp. TaxID=2773933 RepID=UPI002987B176|nr:transcription elongation factor GreA [Evtepia sp.]MDD7289050.1 transcription elongation factor GreA [Clostridiales bacterium]MDY3993376.1 transcription elongation factor GreA [Evtepia sp.]MDY4429516.1 transcription elongation factor GreA [Evtepia sp.]
MTMAKEYRLSAERFEELKQELTYLKTVREKEVAELIKEARSFGDLSENSEYDEAKNEQGKLYSRIAELEEILSNYTIISEQEKNMDIVHVGNTVVVEDLEFSEEETYQIVGSQEADPMNGRISEESPFGRALLGRKAGDEVVVEAPAGNIRYKITAIQR